MVALLRWPNSGLVPELDSRPRIALQRTNVVTADAHQCSPASWNLCPPGNSKGATSGDFRLVAAQWISPPFRTGYLHRRRPAPGLTLCGSLVPPPGSPRMAGRLLSAARHWRGTVSLSPVA